MGCLRVSWPPTAIHAIMGTTTEEVAVKTEYLREFVVFSRYLNFTEAAKELFIAQSTLSTHIAALEGELGFSLIDRKAANRLTDRGAVFLDGVREVLDGLDETLERCRALGNPGEILNISVQYPTPFFAALLRERLPMPFSFVDHDYRDPIFQPIVNGAADIVIDYDYTPFPSIMKEASALNLVTKTCSAFRMSISMMRTNPLASKPALSRDDLRRAHIVINDAHNYDRVRYLYERMLGDDLGLRFSLRPVNGMSGLAYATYGDGLHVCGLSENRHWFADRADIVLYEKLDGKPFGMPNSLTYSADASDRVREGAAVVLECMEICGRENGLAS